MEITANASQTVTTGNNILFTDTPVPGSPSILHREGSGLVTLRGLPNGQYRARFRITFNGNIALADSVSAATAFQIAIAANGEALGATTMIQDSGTQGAYLNVAATTLVDVPIGCCTQISIKNTGTVDILSQNANLIVERVA